MSKYIKSIAALLFFALLTVSVIAQEIQRPAAPKVVNGGIINGKAKSLPKPEYPEAARAVKASGAVNVQVTIDENGDVIEAVAIEGHPLLRASAVAAAQQAKFTPTTLSGQPVRISGVIVYNFVANQVKLGIAGFARNLTLAQKRTWSSDDGLYFQRLAAILPINYHAERTQLTNVAKTNGAEKTQIINDVLNSLEEKMPENEVWQIKLGRTLGEIEFDVRHKIADSAVQLDESKLRKNLNVVNNLIYSAPAEAPPESIEALKKVVNYENQPNISSTETLVALIQAYTEFLKIVSPR